MFLNETWLEDSCSATVLNETAPPNFNFISVCRTVRRGGGVAALFKDVYQCKQVSFGQYLSFEYLGIVLKGARMWKAERMWRKTKLEIHYSIYKDSLHAFNVELATARQTFFSNLINSNLNNTHTLFATVERLTNPPSQIPSEMLSDSKCNEFASFFSEKISNIRKEIGTSSCNTEVTQIRPQSQKKWLCLFLKQLIAKFWKK